MFFETNPWLLIPLIIVTIEGWFALKRAVRRALQGSNSVDQSNTADQSEQ